MTTGYRYALQQWVSDGVRVNYNFSFDGGYLDPSHVKAYREPWNGFSVTGEAESLPVTFTVDNGADGATATVRVGAVPTTPQPTGWRITVYRDTPKDVPLVDFQNGAVLTGGNLNEITKQAIFSIAEVADQFEDLDANVGAGILDLQARVEVAEAQAAQADIRSIDAYTMASTANNTAGSALTAANNAVTTANAASAEVAAQSVLITNATNAANAATAALDGIQDEVDAAVLQAQGAADMANDASAAALAIADVADAANVNATNAVNVANAIDAKAQDALDTADAANTAATTAAADAASALSAVAGKISTGSAASVASLVATGAIAGQFNHTGGYFTIQPFNGSYDDGSHYESYFDGNNGVWNCYRRDSGAVVTDVNISLNGNHVWHGGKTRLQADFSNASVALRTLLQSKAVNGNTYSGLCPNGTGTGSAWTLWNKSDVANAEGLQFFANSNVDMRIQSVAMGTGTLRPMVFLANATEAFRINTNGTTSFATTIGVNGGMSFGSVVATGASLADHIQLHTSGYGFNVVSGKLQAVSNNAVKGEWTSTGYVVTGACNASGGFQSTSSRKVKTALKPVRSALKTLDGMEFVTGKYRQDFHKYKGRKYFAIAESAPAELVVKGIGEYKGEKVDGFDYDGLAVLNSAAIRELLAIVQEQAREIAELKEML